MSHGGGKMRDVVYIDILVVENFFMNYLLLYVISRLCKSRARKWRISAAAFVGALYVLVLFFPDLHLFYSVIMKYMMSILMIIIAFSPHEFKEFLKILILFYIEAFIVGGCLLGVFYLSSSSADIINGALFITNVSPEYIIIMSILATVMVKFGFDYYEGFYLNEKMKIEMDIFLNKKKCSVTALIDTGNSLKDPLTNLPVVVVYYKSILEILPDEVKEAAAKDYSYELFTNRVLNSSLKSRVRIIPYNALGVENGILVGIRMDTIINKFKNKTNIVREPVVALYNKPISNTGDYQALTYPGIIKGDY
jgi:stage II sporulation protein GA (sporulation sigma-E factor processing peptidase)